jgi:hypothetical protein
LYLTGYINKYLPGGSNGPKGRQNSFRRAQDVGMSTGTINLKIPGKPTIPNLYARNDNTGKTHAKKG